MTHSFVVSNSPYASINGEYLPDSNAPNQWLHTDKAHYLYFDSTFEQRWSFSDDKTVMCRSPGATPEPPAKGWEYWKVATGTYIPSTNMSVTKKRIEPPAAPVMELDAQVRHLLGQAAGVHARRDWILQRSALQVKYETAEKALNYAECAKLFEDITVHERRSGSIIPSVEDYRTLADRHQKIVTALEAKCTALLAAKDFGALETYSLLLKDMQALSRSQLAFPSDAKIAFSNPANLSTPTASAVIAKSAELTTEHQQILKQHQAIITQAGLVKVREDWMQRRGALQTQYDKAEAAKHFLECAKLGKDLVALDAEGEKLALSAHDYSTLGERYMQLVSRYKQLEGKRDQAILDLDKARRELLGARNFAGLDTLAQLLSKLQTMSFADLTPPPNLVLPVAPVTAKAAPPLKKGNNSVKLPASTDPMLKTSSSDPALITSKTADPVQSNGQGSDPVNTTVSDPKQAQAAAGAEAGKSDKSSKKDKKDKKDKDCVIM